MVDLNPYSVLANQECWPISLVKLGFTDELAMMPPRTKVQTKVQKIKLLKGKRINLCSSKTKRSQTHKCGPAPANPSLVSRLRMSCRSKQLARANSGRWGRWGKSKLATLNVNGLDDSTWIALRAWMILEGVDAVAVQEHKLGSLGLNPVGSDPIFDSKLAGAGTGPAGHPAGGVGWIFRRDWALSSDS